MSKSLIENLKKTKNIIYIDHKPGISKRNSMAEKVDFKDKSILLVSRSRNVGKSMSKSITDFFGENVVKIQVSSFFQKNDLSQIDIIIFDELTHKEMEKFSDNHDFSEVEQIISLVDFELNLPRLMPESMSYVMNEFKSKGIEYTIVRRPKEIL